MDKLTYSPIPSQAEVVAAQQRIRPMIHHTPVLHSSLLNQMAGAKLFLKCENFQKMGAFKMRGAANAIMSLTDAELAKGVATHSSGNFAQAIALSARMAGVNATVVMPENAPIIKKQAVADYGADIIISESNPQDREAKLENFITQSGATFIHPSNNLRVILGNSTAASELIEEVPDLELIVAPVGGGGLIAGTALAAHYKQKNIEVIGAEPAQVDDAYRSLQIGTIQFNETAHTIADGLRTHLGDINFPIIKTLMSKIVRVEEVEIIEAMQYVWSRMKIIIEPSSAVAVAAILKAPEIFSGKKVGVIISGGNVDLSNLPF